MLPHAPYLAGSASCAQHDFVEIICLETFVALAEDEIESHVTGKGSGGSPKIKGLTRLNKRGDTVTQLDQVPFDHIGTAVYFDLGEERVQRLSTSFVQFMLRGEHRGAICGESIDRPVVFIPYSILSVKLVKKGGIINMQFVW